MRWPRPDGQLRGTILAESPFPWNTLDFEFRLYIIRSIVAGEFGTPVPSS